QEVRVEVGSIMRQVQQLELEAQERFAALDREVAAYAAGPLLEEVRAAFADQPDVVAFIGQVERDLPGHLPDFLPEPQAGQPGMADAAIAAQALQRQERLARYEANVLIDNGDLDGAPVIVERNPTYSNLTGRQEYRSVLGTMVTDFRQIKP